MTMHKEKSKKKPHKKKWETCVIYTRKTATFGDGRNGNELDNNDQRKKCESIINAERKFVISVKRYDDNENNKIIGFYRPALTELINDIKRGLVDTVVVYSLDVLSTDFKILDKILKVFDEYKVRLILAKQWIDSSTTEGRRFFLNVAELIMLESLADEEYLRAKKNEKK